MSLIHLHFYFHYHIINIPIQQETCEVKEYSYSIYGNWKFNIYGHAIQIIIYIFNFSVNLLNRGGHFLFSHPVYTSPSSNRKNLEK